MQQFVNFWGTFFITTRVILMVCLCICAGSTRIWYCGTSCQMDLNFFQTYHSSTNIRTTFSQQRAAQCKALQDSRLQCCHQSSVHLVEKSRRTWYRTFMCHCGTFISFDIYHCGTFVALVLTCTVSIKLIYFWILHKAIFGQNKQDKLRMFTDIWCKYLGRIKGENGYK